MAPKIPFNSLPICVIIGSSFFIAPSFFANAAARPATKETNKPIPVAFKAVLKLVVATFALLSAPPSMPIGPPALSKVSIQSLDAFLDPLILSSKSSI